MSTQNVIVLRSPPYIITNAVGSNLWTYTTQTYATAFLADRIDTGGFGTAYANTVDVSVTYRLVAWNGTNLVPFTTSMTLRAAATQETHRLSLYDLRAVDSYAATMERFRAANPWHGGRGGFTYAYGFGGFGGYPYGGDTYWDNDPFFYYFADPPRVPNLMRLNRDNLVRAKRSLQSYVPLFMDVAKHPTGLAFGVLFDAPSSYYTESNLLTQANLPTNWFEWHPYRQESTIGRIATGTYTLATSQTGLVTFALTTVHGYTTNVVGTNGQKVSVVSFSPYIMDGWQERDYGWRGFTSIVPRLRYVVASLSGASTQQTCFGFGFDQTSTTGVLPVANWNVAQGRALSNTTFSSAAAVPMMYAYAGLLTQTDSTSQAWAHFGATFRDYAGSAPSSAQVYDGTAQSVQHSARQLVVMAGDVDPTATLYDPPQSWHPITENVFDAMGSGLVRSQYVIAAVATNNTMTNAPRSLAYGIATNGVTWPAAPTDANGSRLRGWSTVDAVLIIDFLNGHTNSFRYR